MTNLPYSRSIPPRSALSALSPMPSSGWSVPRLWAYPGSGRQPYLELSPAVCWLPLPLVILSTGDLQMAPIWSVTSAGATMMGLGGVLGLGCSIGQGLTGVSTLSLRSVVVAVMIFAGARMALVRLEKAI